MRAGKPGAGTRWGRRLVPAAICCVCLLAGTAFAAFPKTAPDDPEYAVAEELVGDEPAMPNIQMGGVGTAQAFGQGPGAQTFGQPAAADSTAQLAQLAQLHAAGALTDEEFAAQKAKIIGGG